MADTINEIGIEAQPYKPSWIDLLINWIEKLPVPAWIFYLVFAIVLVLVQVLFLWLDGGQYAEQLLPVIIFNGLLTPFALALIQVLDNLAETALNTMRPILDMSESEFEQYEFRLANMPFLAPLVVGVAMVVFVFVMESVWVVPIRYAALEQIPVFAVVYNIIDKSSAFLLGILIYHTIMQLRLVNSINSNHIRVNLFQLGPLQAFSRVTAATAVGLLIGIYGWMLINPDLLSDPISLGFVAFFTIMAAAVFLWPLVGAHRLMQKEKESMLHSIDLQFEAVFAKFNQRIQDDDYTAIEQLNGTIASLEIQQRKIMAIPTWPWGPGTVRSVFTAIALPLVLRVLQLLFDQAFAW